jgi:hypothetical protein
MKWWMGEGPLGFQSMTGLRQKLRAVEFRGGLPPMQVNDWGDVLQLLGQAAVISPR